MEQLTKLYKELRKAGANIHFCHPQIQVYGLDKEELAKIIKANPVDGFKAFPIPNRDGGFSHFMLIETDKDTIWL